MFAGSRVVAVVPLILILVASSLSPSMVVSAGADSGPGSQWQTKVDPWVLETAAAGETEFLVFLKDQAELGQLELALRPKAERGQRVYEALTALAQRTQGPVRKALAELGVQYRPFWVANMLWVRGNLSVVQAMAMRSDVAHVYANPQVPLDLEAIARSNARLLSTPNAIEWNISHVGAPDVWAQGYTGQGAVVGGQDTGYQWDHPALKNQYRGWDGASADHDYNWHDAIHSSSGDCPGDSPAPCDDHNHGTHTMGTMVGDDGAGNQIGMAPGARWIGCRNMDEGVGTPATYSECYQWFIAPTRVDGSDPDPAMAPDVINNSWGCPLSEGCTDPTVLLTVVQNVRAAGIVTVHSAGNEGPSCSSVETPAAIYAESFSVGATDSSDAIAYFSSRGPVTVDGSNRRKPDISAPGVNIRSSVVGGYAGGWQGTSMAGPHVAGLVALLISASPELAGNADAIEDAIEQSAVPRTSAQTCGGDTRDSVPNNVYGWGRIDAWAAYQAVSCQAPAAVANVEISAASASEVQLSWDEVSGADHYEVWHAVNDPYFTPGLDCAGSFTCDVAVTTSYSHASLGTPQSHTTYQVRAANSCGVSGGSNRTGEFEYELMPGS